MPTIGKDSFWLQKPKGVRKKDDPPTLTEDEVREKGDEIDKGNDQAHYALNQVRDNNSPTGYTTKVVGGKKNETQAEKRAGYDAEHKGGSAVAHVTGGKVQMPKIPNVNDVLVEPDLKDVENDEVRQGVQHNIYSFLGVDAPLSKEEREKRARRDKRNLLLAGIGNGLDAFHTAYAHARGVEPMFKPGATTDKYIERYNKMLAERRAKDKEFRTAMEQQAKMEDLRRRENLRRDALDLQREREERLRDKQKGAAGLQQTQGERNKAAARYTNAKAEGQEEQNKYIPQREQDRHEESQSRVNKNNRTGTGGSSSSSRGGGSGSGGTKTTSKGTKTQKGPTTAEEVVEISNDDPKGWQSAVDALWKNTGRKPSKKEIVEQYKRMHPNRGTNGGAGGGGQRTPIKGVTFVKKPK